MEKTGKTEKTLFSNLKGNLMTREEAKEWVSIPREKIKKIAKNIDKNFGLVKAYSKGAEIEFRYMRDSEFQVLDSPEFSFEGEYRIKEDVHKDVKVKTEEVFVESYNGEPLSKAEKRLLDILRDIRFEVIGEQEFSYVRDDTGSFDHDYGILIVLPYDYDTVEHLSNALRKIKMESGEKRSKRQE